MPVHLVSDRLASGELMALRDQPPLPKVAYSAAYIPSNSFKIVPLIVALCKGRKPLFRCLVDRNLPRKLRRVKPGALARERMPAALEAPERLSQA